MSASALTTLLERLKLIIISVDDFSNEEVKDAFLDFEITNEEEIRELMGIIREHRPQLMGKLAQAYCEKGAA